MANGNLNSARSAKNDEFYTQFPDIEKEMSAYLEHDPDVFRDKTILLPCDDPEWSNFTRYFLMNFTALGLKKLISTSYAPDRKTASVPATDFESSSPEYDPSKTESRGKIFTVSRDTIDHALLTLDDLEWQYLEGDGDFRSAEVTRLRDEADVIITNPPFSLFREFLAWIVEANKQFLIVGSMNAITYKEVFPLIKANRVWSGCSNPKGFTSPDGQLKKFGNVQWYTNIDHNRRHEPLSLMTMERNLKHSKHQAIKDAGRYLEYDNYNAIDVPHTDAIPSDYDGVMGVPISFLDRYNPDQFELLGSNRGIGQDPNGVYGRSSMLNGKETFKRLFIKHRREN
jgi:hypothetical protein